MDWLFFILMEFVAEDAPLDLYDPRNGDLSLRIEPLHVPTGGFELSRSNYFSVHWIQDGGGVFWADFGRYAFGSNSLLFLVPYQLSRFESTESVRGLTVQFHANFFCIETHHEEVGCNGILFNDLYGFPVVRLSDADVQAVARLFEDMGRELRGGALAHSEVLVSFLKILLVQATRLKLQQQDLSRQPASTVPAELGRLQESIETHFRLRHAPADYAELLSIGPKSLARLVKTHLRKTLTELIRERIVKQAKWELLHTVKPIKQIAMDLGFDDIFYFSRLFKRVTGCSPTFFRDYETEIRSGRNLSMQ
jgi:AraC family transcriptional regulator, transcriptional activator of pobA